ncbi:PilW family protein [Halomonas getboli]|uniref:PilW family protein n=1 Tax=Halomonas getboli TaxID=2935862 RepID=UPI001FFF5371|nr:prepilin-type N-terminal cleavage/methylation domain-containing protein [Halomonas getboli]MCK2183813.1 prepilin-type N-terminal cleavage/methylation domain-containing protein [Halomonas getboli]
MPRHQAGFSLVEMMIATVIGLLVLIGATQLYLTISRSQDRSEMLAERQQALTFGTESLMRDIRTARGALEVSDDGSELTLNGVRRSAYCPGNGTGDITLTYSREGDELVIDPVCLEGLDNTMSLISGISGFDVISGEDSHSVEITLTLSADDGAPAQPLTFVAVNRQQAMQSAMEKAPES